MSFGSVNKFEMRKRALLEAIRFCGGITAVGRKLKVGRTRVSNWLNKPDMEIPFQYAILIEDITQVSIERLSPNTESANKVIRRLRGNNKLTFINVELNSIQNGDHHYSKCVYPERTIIIGTDGVLISGLAQVEKLKCLKQKIVQVAMLDLEAIVLGQRSLNEVNIDLLISEQLAIGLRMEKLIGNQQGKRNDIKGVDEQININEAGKNQLRRPGDEVGRVDIYVSNLVGLGSKDTYRRAKEVCLHGSVELIHSMDSKKISIKKVAEKTKTASNHSTTNIQCNKE